ncbi:cytochrome c1 [Altererythrobacter indicus]|uniref:Cytochrome c1 n=1 Tax=Altericroceibacterium indicum TaxID=374177 RepID=A0A845ACN9_9SPHN|nr:cytochrome c1 [Altericroceibacterium indicum]MXP27159.1 cytochrome c1 [Altericroceibacterium indicum]
MIRFIGIAAGAFFALSVLWAFVTGAYSAATEPAPETAEHAFHKHPKELHLASDGPFGTWNLEQLQRGYQVYKEVCSACHSLKFVAMRDLEQLGYSEAEVKAEAASWTVPGIDPNTGETTTRPGEPTDYFPSPYPNNVAAAAANNNAIPPDLSLMTKARHDGSAYVYSLLTGFQQQPTELLKKFPSAKTPEGLHYNPYFANLNLAMAPPLTMDGQVTYADGTKATIDQMAQDVSAFLTWTAEPTMPKRKQTGWPVLGFLLFATILAYMAKQQIWSNVKPAKNKQDD